MNCRFTSLRSDHSWLEDLPASGRLADGRGPAVAAAAWEQVITWRAMIRMRTDLELATNSGSRPASPVPPVGQVIALLGLWQRSQPAEVPAPAALW